MQLKRTIQHGQLEAFFASWMWPINNYRNQFRSQIFFSNDFIYKPNIEIFNQTECLDSIQFIPVSKNNDLKIDSKNDLSWLDLKFVWNPIIVSQTSQISRLKLTCKKLTMINLAEFCTEIPIKVSHFCPKLVDLISSQKISTWETFQRKIERCTYAQFKFVEIVWIWIVCKILQNKIDYNRCKIHPFWTFLFRLGCLFERN